MKALCIEAGLEADKVTGYAKGYGYKGGKFKETNHAWNVIKVDDQWRLFDVTWASGSGTEKNGKLVSQSSFEPFWFDVNPKAFIFTHLPDDSQWQLTGHAITLEIYEKLSYLSSTFFQTGFDPGEIFNVAMTGKVKEFVEVSPTKFPLNAVNVPYTKFLIKNKILDLEIFSDYAGEIALIEDDKWNYFKKENKKFSLRHTPTGKRVKISIKINSFDKSFYTILTYKIVKREKVTNANNVYQDSGQ